MELSVGTTLTVKRRVWYALKVIVLLFLALTAGGTITSYVLAAMDLDPNTDVTVALIDAFGKVAFAYAAKNILDHWSMNKHGIQEVD